MRNLLKLVFQRVVAVSFGIALQIIFLIVMATYLRTDFFWIRIAMNVLSWAVVIYIISCGVNPSYKIAWIVLILAFPVAGLTIYLLFGGNKISSYEHRKMQSIEAVTMQQLRQDEAPLWELAAAETPAFNHARYLLSASGYPIYDDADAEYFPSGESCYAAMLEEIKKAERYIFIEFFIIATGKMWDPMLELLRQKAAAGVDVRVVYDDFGCITRLPMGYAKKLQEKGAKNVLVSMAGEGAVLIDENGREYMSPVPKGKVVNAVGAGDSMVAGFIAGYLEKKDYEYAFHMGIASGSASAFSEQLATRAEVEALLKTIHSAG